MPPLFRLPLRNVLVLLLLISCLLPAAGCITRVRFPPHAPYSPMFTRPGRVFLTFPTDLDDQVLRIRPRGMIDPARVRVYWGQALKTEARARFARVFEGGVVFYPDEAVEPLRKEIARLRDSRVGTATTTTLTVQSPIPSSPALITDEDTSSVSISEFEGREADRQISDVEILAIAQNPPTVLIRFTNVEADYSDSRATVRFFAEAIDVRTGNVLLRNSYRSAGKRVLSTQSEAVLGQGLRDTTTDAFNSALIRLTADLEQVIP